MKLKSVILKMLVMSVFMGVLMMSSSHIAHALQSGFDVVNFIPATDDTDYFSIYGSRTLTPRQFSTSLIFDYGRKPLECEGCPQADIVRHLFVGHYNFAIGATRWMQLGFSVPIILYNEFVNDTTGAQDFDGGVGDVGFEPKFRLLDIERHNVGLALLPFITLPTGDSSKFEGSEHITGGAKIITDVDILERVGLSANIGYRLRDDVTKTSTTVDDQILYGLGMTVHALRKLDVIVEAQGWTVAKDLFGSVAQSPLEANAGIRYRADNGFALALGGGPGLVDGIGTPTFRAIAGVSFTPPTAGRLPGEDISEAHAEIRDGQIVISDRVYFDFDKAVVKPESYPILNAVARLLEQNSQVQLVEVQGHTDSVGTDGYNQTLSERRAHAVVDYLMQQGIAEKRLTAKGYGESKPIATNETDAGRALNRRTEFHILIGEK